jgi:hypothetical protein
MKNLFKNKVYLLAIAIIILFLITFTGSCTKSDAINCDLPFSKSLFLSDNFIFSTYTSLCGGDVLESGLVITDTGNDNTVISNGQITTKDWANDIYIESDYAYIANGANGLLIINISDEQNPTTESRIDTPGYANSVFVSVNMHMLPTVIRDYR